MYLRINVWSVTMAYAGFLMTGGKNLSSPSMMSKRQTHRPE
jgi:hypothetical protein